MQQEIATTVDLPENAESIEFVVPHDEIFSPALQPSSGAHYDLWKWQVPFDDFETSSRNPRPTDAVDRNSLSNVRSDMYSLFEVSSHSTKNTRLIYSTDAKRNRVVSFLVLVFSAPVWCCAESAVGGVC